MKDKNTNQGASMDTGDWIVHEFALEIIENLPAIVFIKNAKNFRYTYVNKKCEQLLGIKRTEIINKTDYDLFPKALADSFRTNDLKTITHGRIEDVQEEKVLTRNAGMRIVHTKKLPLYDHHNKPLFLLGLSEDITALTTTLKTLENSRQFLRLIMENVPDPIFVKDRSHRWIEGNTAFWKMMNGTREQFIGKSDYDVFTKKEADVFWKKDDQTFKSGKTTQNLESFTNPKGKRYIIDTKKSVFTNESGKQILVGTIRDMTDWVEMQKNLEAAHNKLKSSQRFLRGVMNNMPDPIFVKDENHIWIDGNAAFWKFMGGKPEDFIGKSDYDFFPEEIADKFREQDRQTFKSGHIRIEEEIYFKPKGKHIIISTQKTFFKDEFGQKILIGTFRDITAKRKAEKELNIARDELERKFNETESIYKTVLDNTTEGLITFNDDGIIHTYNKACEDIFRYTRREALLNDIQSLIPTLTPQQIKSYDKTLMQDSAPAKKIKNITGQNKNGEQIPLELVIKRLQIDSQIRYCLIVRDITERIKTNRERRHYLNTLKAKNRELDDFAYIASHDLKGPLRGIHNYAQFLNEDYKDALDEEGQEMLGQLTTLTQQLDSYLDTLLKYSRLGRETLTIKKTDMDKLVKKVLAVYLPEIKEKDIKLTQHPLPTIMCDPVKISDVFINLIDNALKYTEESGGSIEIGYIDSHPDHPDSHVFYIKDSGIGIDPDYLQVIFKIFKRLHAKDRYGGGSGAGLTISKRIIDRHKGTIWAESKGQGAGSCFYFSIPKNLSAQ